jgi:IPT/TIG domain
MKRCVVVLIGVLAASPASGEGINLSWNDCGLHGTDIQSFACNTNSGAHEAVGSFVPPTGVDQFIAIAAELLIESPNDLPDWWRHGNGFCRGVSGLASSFDFTAVPSSCVDPWNGQASGGHQYDVAFGGPNRARLRLFAAMPTGYEIPVDPGTEYSAFRVRLLHSKTTGTGSCTGCGDAVQLMLNSIQLYQPSGVNPLVTMPIDRTTIYWQNTFGPLPEITAVSPNAGPEGTPVTITGSRFTGITSVRFHTVEAGFTVVSDTEISTAVPDDARTGIVHVQGPDGIGNSSDPFIVAPEITGFSPGRGPVGSTVVLTGINFTATSGVTFNGTPSTSFSVDADTRLLAAVPAGATDGPITVVNAGGSDVTDGIFEVGPVPIPGDGAINLSWDDCGTAGGDIKTFACNTNTGSPFTMVASFGAPDNIQEFIGVQGTFDITTSEATLPNWWRHGSGQCRGTTGLGTIADFTGGPFSCLDPWQGMGVGGNAYDVEFGGPEHARLRVIAALPSSSAIALDPGNQYYAFKVLLLSSKTVGTGNCAGCAAPACIGLLQLQLFQDPDQAYDPLIQFPGDRNYVYWQSSSGLPACPAAEPPPLPTAVPSPQGSPVSIDRAIALADGRGVSLSLTLEREGDGRVEVFDSSGRRRMSRFLTGLGPGRHDLQISGSEPMASGVYFVRVVQGSSLGTRRFSVIR